MLDFVTKGVSYAFTTGASPGAFQGYLATVTLKEGWRKSLPMVLAPLITDGPIIVLMAFLLHGRSPELRRLIQIFGGLFLLWIAWGAFKELRAGLSIPM